MTKKTSVLFPIVPLLTLGSLPAMAEPSIGGGLWLNYSKVTDSIYPSKPEGEVGGEALILYIDSKDKASPWLFSTETRFGRGSFSDPVNNWTGGKYTIHKAWVGYRFAEKSQLILGKNQVPFGWKTANFWPGDLLLGGYGDQMDVGLKYSRENDSLKYDLAYYHADDWGSTSTDTTDDNGHWGSSVTYRKVRTLVGNIDYRFAPGHTLGVSLQSGKLQNLSSASARATNGTHHALNLHYVGQFDKLYTKAQYLSVHREIPNLANDIDNWRAAVEVGYKDGNWSYYLDASTAESRTKGNNAGNVTAHAAGVSYSYGSGNLYLEYLNSSGDIDRNGDPYKSDFSAVYATVDYYF